MKITVVIAAYNEAQNIATLTERLIRTLDAIENIRWELIYVIEGLDETLSIAQRFAKQVPRIRILYQAEPGGLGKAFRKGFDAITSDTSLIITMDADLNHQPEEIPQLVEALRKRNADIVVGSRKVAGSLAEGIPMWKRILSHTVNSLMRRIMRMPVADQTSGYRVYRAEVLRNIWHLNDGFAFLPEILIRAHSLGYRIVEAPIRFTFRTEGESKMKLLPTMVSYLSLFHWRTRFATRSAQDR